MSPGHFGGKELRYLFSHAKGRQGCTSSNLWTIKKNQRSLALKMSLHLGRTDPQLPCALSPRSNGSAVRVLTGGRTDGRTDGPIDGQMEATKYTISLLRGWQKKSWHPWKNSQLLDCFTNELKADRPHPPDYSTHRQNSTHKLHGLIITLPKIKVVGQTVQPWEIGQTDGRTDGCYQVHYLPRFAVDNQQHDDLSIVDMSHVSLSAQVCL